MRAPTLTPREAARLTAQKIDQIESEMIDGAEQTPPAANSTRMGPLTESAPPATAAASPGMPSGMPDDRGQAMAIDVGDSALPPHLEEAAILYANGQVEAAIESLAPTLAEAAPGFERLAWLMMFDLCQFAGDRERFDAVSLEYATRFETSPPVWNDRLAPVVAADERPQSGVGAARSMPAILGADCSAAVDQLLRSAARREPVADFSGVTSVDAQGAAEILRLFKEIVAMGARLQVRGAAALSTAACAAIEPGGESQSEASWMLALYSLRLLDRRQQFDDLSIDYCVTFEVSPPPWEAPPAQIVADSERGGSAPEPTDAPERTEAPRASASLRPSTAFVLAGELLGRVRTELQSLKAYARDRGEVIVDCRELRRMDFAAAGELLNEIANLRAHGKNLLFVEPNHLVHALMVVMGMHELAEIRRRKG